MTTVASWMFIVLYACVVVAIGVGLLMLLEDLRQEHDEQDDAAPRVDNRIGRRSTGSTAPSD
jgi:hypothetical protein